METLIDRKFKILIVDDNINNVQVLGTILREQGYLVGFASNGRQALNILNDADDFDLVLLDIDMPVMDGYETCKEIRTIKKMEEMIVIFLTAYTDREILIKGLELGAQDYVVKPFYSRELMLRINTHLLIKYKNEQLRNMNQILEQKVDERTIELYEANKKLANLDNAKNYCIGLLSHELRTPLIGINGNAKMIKEISEDSDIIDSCDDILASENRLRKFIEMALLITSIKAEKVEMRHDYEKIFDFIDSAVNKTFSFAESKQVKINYDISDKEFMIEGDYSLIFHVFDFVIDNAVKFSPINSNIDIKDLKKNGEYSVVVTDTGPGFTNDMLERKFELLQSDELLSHSEGTGLSLFAAKAIMDLHGFKITIQNAESGGAEVILSFPVINNN